MQEKIIHNKTLDLFFIKFPIIFPITYALILFTFPSFENFLIFGTLILLAEPHFGATWPFLLNKLNHQKILSEKINFIFIPIIIIILSLFLFIFSKNLLYLIFYFANFYHVTRQSSGVSKLFINKNNINELKFHTFLIYFFGILFGFIGLIRFQFYNLIYLNVFYLNYLIILIIIALSTYYYFKFRNYKNILLLLTGILIFYPVCFVNAPIHAIIMGVTMHYTQYLFITYKVTSGRLFEINNNKTFNYLSFIIIISFYGIIMGLLSISNTFTNATFGYLIAIPLIGQLLHFYYDSLLWKFSDEHNRKVTLKFI
ncbi:hypothetical protein OAI01_05845 [Alphaproteobacteria bacterium]|nr:hypothetical protein [Alphaproteobacteria bacterium]